MGWAQPAATPVILISVDTLRADHLSCYQSGNKTPHIDSLAQHGTLFSQASSAFPLTLPSHTALLTSTYPFTNGVEDNGIPLRPSSLTLARIFKKAGYHTGAFIASFVLDRRFGLNQGFDVYDGPLDIHSDTARPVERKRPGAQVAQAALHWIDSNSAAPYFLFLHLYDLHLPYDLPQGYNAEIAYEDKVLGDFFAALKQRKLFDKALIVFTSDHGEGIGDHGESTHGYFLYQTTVRVPLIVHWPAEFNRAPAAAVNEPASLLDVAPTILDAAGIPASPAMRGHSLLSGAKEREIYSESLYARKHFGCASLRSLRVGSYKYIEAPKPELYDLSNDPGETKNLYSQQRPKADSLARQLAALRRAAPPSARPASQSADSAAALRSLGYLSGSSHAIQTESRIDPKDRAANFEQYVRALDLASAGKLSESSAIFEKLSREIPDVPEIRLSLGLNQQRAGDCTTAINTFKSVLQQDPSDAQAHFETGFCQFRLAQMDAAAQHFKAALLLEPWYARAAEALAQIYIQKNDLAQANTYLQKLLAIDPDSYTAHYNLGILSALQQNWPDAEHHLQAAARIDPNSTEAQAALAKVKAAQAAK